MSADSPPSAVAGLPVVLLHGQPGAASDWDAVAAALPPDVPALAFDRPGYRGSPHPPGGFAANARWLLSELDRAEVPEAVLVGHSYGGGVALTAAAIAPRRVRGLVLVASVGPGCLDGWDALLAAPLAGPVCALAAWWLTPWFARRRVARIERKRRRPLDPHEHVNWEIWGNARHENGAMWRTFLTEQRELVHGIGHLATKLEQVRAPSLVIADPSDKLIPVATAYAIRDRLAHAQLVLASAGGHHLPRREPAMVAGEITRFVNTLG